MRRWSPATADESIVEPERRRGTVDMDAEVVDVSYIFEEFGLVNELPVPS